MFAYEWGLTKKTVLKKYRGIKSASPIVWAEHCLECAAPLCYNNCTKYRKRIDGKCRLFADGINKNVGNGILNYSATISFCGWSKLEAAYRIKQHSIFYLKLTDKFTSLVFAFFKKISLFLEKNNKVWHLTNFAYAIREGICALSNWIGAKPDAFYILVESYSHDAEIIIETKNKKNEFFYKRSFKLLNGLNEIIIPFDEIKMPKSKSKRYIFLYPNSDCTLTFCALDFVRFTKEYKKELNENFAKRIDASRKIKCVAWDLDNTLWDGVLVNGNTTLKSEIVNFIKELDSKGIVNSIISKNDFKQAWERIKEIGLDNLFVMPQINWIPKSINIKNLAKKMNIGIDSICFVDDSLFELEEVHSSCPDVMCINVKDIDVIRELHCFNAPVTEDAKKRKETYKMMEKEQAELENWEGNINDFLKTCLIRVVVSKPLESELMRCYELLQRTNQLNSSGRRLEYEQVREMVFSKDYETFVIKCSDKFGDYGIVGFSILKKKTKTITDFVISCRVANKTIEQTFITFVAKNYTQDGTLMFNYRKTIKNGPMFKIVSDLNMKLVGTDGEIEKYKLDLKLCQKTFDVVELTYK